MSDVATAPATGPASPSEAAAASERKRTRASAGKFAVLKEVKSMDDLADLLATGEVEVFAVVRTGVPARTGPKAIEAVAVSEDSVEVGRYVGVPMASWQPRNVRQVVHMTLE